MKLLYIKKGQTRTRNVSLPKILKQIIFKWAYDFTYSQCKYDAEKCSLKVINDDVIFKRLLDDFPLKIGEKIRDLLLTTRAIQEKRFRNSRYMTTVSHLQKLPNEMLYKLNEEILRKVYQRKRIM